MQAQHDPVVHLNGDEVQRRRETSEADQSGTGVTADEQDSLRAVGAQVLAKTGRRPDIARDLLRRRDLAATGWTTPAAAMTEVQRAAMRETNRANTVVLRRILADHGWPGTTLAGADAARAAWQIALHADDVDFQKHALELLADAVSHGEALPAHWAHLYDRCCVLAGVPQWFGTQYRYSSDGVEPYPPAEPDALDEWRALYGLEPHGRKAEAVRLHHAGVAA